MKLYRYLDSPFGTELMREGKIRLGTFAKYQKLETEEGDLVRGDSEDGSKHIFISEYRSDGGPVPEALHALFGKTMGAGAVLKDCIVSMQSGNMLVLCMSDILSTEIAQSFYGTAECIQIDQPDLFFHRITRELKRKLGGAVEFLGVFPCEYVDSRQFQHTDPRAATAAPYLLKPHRYASQREHRAIWQCQQLLSDMGHIDLVCPKLRSLCSLVDFRVHAGCGWSYKLLV
uniref:Uncharacterized protein n=1 Tax=Dechloromonas aromatica (strain RCB) TaxID=159087 RepID=Q47HX5_DECAR